MSELLMCQSVWAGCSVSSSWSWSIFSSPALSSVQPSIAFLSHSFCLQFSPCLLLSVSLPRSCDAFTYSPWFSGCALSPSVSSLSLYPPSNLSVSLHRHLFYFQDKQQTLLSFCSIRICPDSLFDWSSTFTWNLLCQGALKPNYLNTSNYPFINDW